MSTSSRVTEPARAALGMSSCIRFRILKNVDLPHPDGPINAVTWPGFIDSEIRSRTLFFPNHALTSRATRPAGWLRPGANSPDAASGVEANVAGVDETTGSGG